MVNYSARPSRDIYLNLEKALDKNETNLLAQRAIGKRYGHFLIAAEIENFLRIPLILYSRLVAKSLRKLEEIIGPRPALKMGAKIQAATFWTPEQITDTVALTLASSSVLGFAFEKAVGKTNVDKLFSAAKKPFQALSFSAPASIKKPLNVVLKKAYKGTQLIQTASKNAYSQSACVTVFGHHDKILRFGNDSVL